MDFWVCHLEQMPGSLICNRFLTCHINGYLDQLPETDAYTKIGHRIVGVGIGATDGEDRHANTKTCKSVHVVRSVKLQIDGCINAADHPGFASILPGIEIRVDIEYRDRKSVV